MKRFIWIVPIVPLSLSLSLWAATLYAHEAITESGPAADDKAMAPYFGNSAVLRRKSDGRIHVIIYYKPDRTFRVWDEGAWKKDGTWLTNNGQDYSIVCLTKDLGNKPFTMCHTMKLGRKLGDHWAASEPAVIAGGVPFPDSPVMKTSTTNETYIEKGVVPPPDPFVPLPPRVGPSPIPDIAPDDKAMAGYFGNSVVLRNSSGAVSEIDYFKSDRTFRQWRAGVWSDGTWVTNNGQDHSILCVTENHLGKPVSYCLPMTPDRTIGAHWSSLSTDSRHSSMRSASLEKGHIPPP